MTPRPRRLARVLAPAILLPCLLGSPAAATTQYAAPVVSTPDTTTTGHVTGTVASAAPYVRIELLDPDSGEVIDVTASPGGAPTPYDFETWGWSSVAVRATACTTSADCPGGSFTTEAVTTTTVQPSITWPADTTIGTQNTDYVIDVQDSGGGFLQATWGDQTMPIPSAGQVDLMPLLQDDGNYYLLIERCSTNRPDACVVAAYRSVSVRRHFQATAATGSVSLSPDNTSAPDGAAHYLLSAWVFSSSFSYTLRPVGVQQAVRSGTVTVTTTGTGDTSVPLDVTGLPDGSYLLDGTFSRDAPSYGTLTGIPASPDLVIVDSRAPEVRSIAFDRPTVYPYLDGYQDTVAFHVVGDGTDTSITTATYDILDGTGKVVWTSTTAPAAGLTGEGGTWSPGSAPAGAYVVRATVRDAAGNTTIATSQPVTLSRARLVHKQYYRLVKAKASLVSKSVGRCSVVRSPSLRGYAGSLGLYSGVRCTRPGAAAMVRTVHRMRVPKEVLGGKATIYLAGGASHSRRSGVAWFGWQRDTGDWLPFSRAAWFMGSHRDKGGAVAVADLVTGGDYLTWGVMVDSGKRYDVDSFAVSIDYTALR